MKRVFMMFILFFIGVVSWTTQGYATVQDLPEGPWCYASYWDRQSQYPLEDEGPNWASVSQGPGEAASQAQGRSLGARVSAKVGPGASQTYYAHYSAAASFDQPFKVTQAGEASVTFSWQGSMEISASSDYPVNENDWWELGFYVDLFGGFERFKEVSDCLYSDSGTGYAEYAGSYTFTYNFTQDDIGKVFWTSAYLAAYLTADLARPEEQGDYYVTLASDFMDTLELTDFSGGIAPVPIPGAVWLFGTGLLGLVAIRRPRRNR